MSRSSLRNPLGVYNLAVFLSFFTLFSPSFFTHCTTFFLFLHYSSHSPPLLHFCLPSMCSLFAVLYICPQIRLLIFHLPCIFPLDCYVHIKAFFFNAVVSLFFTASRGMDKVMDEEWMTGCGEWVGRCEEERLTECLLL